MRSLALLVWVALAIALAFPAFRRFRPLRRSEPDELVKDPVCQTYVVRSRAIRRESAGEAHYFCSVTCAQRFAAGVN
ncbi:MAG: hypothetical protein HY216_07175 [Candidatus Rokubacteria bacterium]|nr:hypothetical protein [Candidatus Rokubacteria bacterium]